jgi:hypothetical protein
MSLSQALKHHSGSLVLSIEESVQNRLTHACWDFRMTLEEGPSVTYQLSSPLVARVHEEGDRG